jgi:hypothetical protein
MDTQKTSTAPEFSGTKAEKELAARLFRVFLARAAFFSADAPIRLSLTQIAEFLESTEGGSDWSKKVDKALTANEHVFLREEEDGEVVFVTTKVGRPPVQIETDGIDPNDLKARFATPEPRREPLRPRRASVVSPGADVEDIVQPEDEHAFAPDSWQAAVAAALRDAQVRDQGVVSPRADEAGISLDDIIAETGEMEPEAVIEETEVLETELIEEDIVQPTEAIDITEASDDELAEAIRNSLSHEPDVARWGDLWMHEAKVAKLSRGDLRRAQEYIDENGEPLGDIELVQDLRGINAGAPDFPLERFTVNFRLSREVRDFEYLGTSTEGLWATTSMPALGTDKRKASELGQDYRFLLDYQTPPEDLEEGIIEHVLTFYEYHYGVLPLDATVSSIMPAPAFSDQRAARITMESPQTGETFAVELRFPTSNRGGYIVGLDQFFESSLVPGALVTIESTDNPSHFIIEYFQMSGQDRRLLHLDARKNRYVFRPTTFYCGLQDDMLIDENRFPRFADAEPLDERTRRRPDQVIAATFVRVGENVGSADEPRYSASLVDLLAAANVERPISVELLRDILTGGTYPEFSINDKEEDAFFYQPQ